MLNLLQALHNTERSHKSGLDYRARDYKDINKCHAHLATWQGLIFENSVQLAIVSNYLLNTAENIEVI